MFQKRDLHRPGKNVGQSTQCCLKESTAIAFICADRIFMVPACPISSEAGGITLGVMDGMLYITGPR